MMYTQRQVRERHRLYRTCSNGKTVSMLRFPQGTLRYVSTVSNPLRIHFLNYSPSSYSRTLSATSRFKVATIPHMIHAAPNKSDVLNVNCAMPKHHSGSIRRCTGVGDARPPSRKYWIFIVSPIRLRSDVRASGSSSSSHSYSLSSFSLSLPFRFACRCFLRVCDEESETIRFPERARCVLAMAPSDASGRAVCGDPSAAASNAPFFVSPLSALGGVAVTISTSGPDSVGETG